MTFYLAFLLCLLSTLIVRLWLVFKDSIWRMSDRMRSAFITLYTLLLLVTVLNLSALFVRDHHRGHKLDDGKNFFEILLYVSRGAWLLVYAMTSILAVYLFVHNLLLLAAQQTSSSNNVLDAASLNKRQMQRVKQSTKYLSLFLLAMVSTSCIVVLSFAAKLIAAIMWRFDVCLNVLCLYLQFRFANQHYDKFCCKVDGCTRKIIEICARKKIASFKAERDARWNAERAQQEEEEVLRPQDAETDSDI